MCIYCSLVTGIPSAGKIQHKDSLRERSLSDDLSGIGMVIVPGVEENPSNIKPAAAPTTYGTIQQLADYLRVGFWDELYSMSTGAKWDMSARSGVITYNTTGTNNSYDSDGISTARAALAVEGFKYYSNIFGFTFTEDTSGSADITFSDDESGAFSNHAISSSGFWSPGQINVNSAWAGGGSEDNGYIYTTFIHEIGHSLGLGHLGGYNALPGVTNYWTSSNWANDSRAISAMSYISNSQNPNIDAKYRDEWNATMGPADILALDDIYKADGFSSANAFSGDTIYGNNTNITEATNINLARMADGTNNYIDSNKFTIVDGSGNDTIDFSNYSVFQTIDLRQSAQTDSSQTVFYSSDVGNIYGSLSIAPGTVIENAIGGSAADTLTGNPAANSLTGGAGNDTMSGGAGNDSMTGGTCNDSMTGGAGDDTFVDDHLVFIGPQIHH